MKKPVELRTELSSKNNVAIFTFQRKQPNIRVNFANARKKYIDNLYSNKVPTMIPKVYILPYIRPERVNGLAVLKLQCVIILLTQER